MRQEGLRIGNELDVCVPEDQRIRPILDRILVEPLPWRPSRHIEVVYGGHALRGTIRAIGPGHNPIKYNGPKGKRTLRWFSHRFRPTQLKVGDVVELGGLEIRGYLFHTVMWGTKEHVICREEDVVWVYE